LFPEALALLDPTCGHGNMEEALDRHCRSPSSRLAAVDLLVHLMTPSADSMEDGIEALNEIHFRNGPVQISK